MNFYKVLDLIWIKRQQQNVQYIVFSYILLCIINIPKLNTTSESTTSTLWKDASVGCIYLLILGLFFGLQYDVVLDQMTHTQRELKCFLVVLLLTDKAVLLLLLLET